MSKCAIIEVSTMKYNFSNMNDIEILNLEVVLNLELDSRLRKMILDEELKELQNKLEEVESQKKKRGLDG